MGNSLQNILRTEKLFGVLSPKKNDSMDLLFLNKIKFMNKINKSLHLKKSCI